MRSLLVVTVLLASAGGARAALLHYYPFSSGATDAVGTADGTLIGGAAVAGGQLSLDGGTGYVAFGSHIVPTSGSYTVAFFEKTDTLNTSYTEMISQGFSGGPGFYLGKDSGAGIRATDSWGNTGVAFPADGLWHHFALVVDATANTSILYIDGAVGNTLGSAISTTTGGTDTYLGKQFGGYTEYFPGSLDEVRIYDNALSRSEVAAIISVPEPTAACASLAGAALLLNRRRASSK